eukprot:scaffold275309_cov18-Prasinocladus_malaysianus.AAC.1
MSSGSPQRVLRPPPVGLSPGVIVRLHLPGPLVALQAGHVAPMADQPRGVRRGVLYGPGVAPPPAVGIPWPPPHTYLAAITTVEMTDCQDWISATQMTRYFWAYFRR